MKTFPLFVLALVVAVGEVRAEDLLDGVLKMAPSKPAPQTEANGAQPSAAQSAKSAAKASQPQAAEAESQPADDLIDAMFAAPLTAPASLPAPSVHEGGNGVSSASDVVNETVDAVMRLPGEPTASPTAPNAGRVPKAELSASTFGHIENPATFFLRGGGADGSMVIGMESRFPVGNSAFDISFRGTLCSLEKEYTASDTEVYYTYWYSWWTGMHRYRHTRTRYYEATKREDRYLADFAVQWNPYRGSMLEPFVGLGARYDFLDYEDDSSDNSEGNVTYVAKIGLKMNFSRLFLTGEYIFGGDAGDAKGVSEAIGDLGFYVTRRMQLHAFVESFKLDMGSDTVVGGGLSFDF